MQAIEKFFNRFSNVLGTITMIVLVLMMLNIAYDALTRYFFNTNSMAMQEMEWHLFSIIILLGVSYGLLEEGHVRVDVLYHQFSCKTKALINMGGVVLFIWPIALLVAFGSIEFVTESYSMSEKSGDPGGLPHRFIIKALISLSFFILILTSIGYFARHYNLYKGVTGDAS